MMGTTHRTGSIALACGIIALAPMDKIGLAPAATFLAASAIGGLVPDADTPYSTYGRKFLIVLWPFYLIRKIISLLGHLFAPLEDVGKALGHRGMFHSPTLWTLLLGTVFGVMKISGVQNVYGYAALFGLFAGVMSHIFLDFISGGVPLLAPFSLKRYTPPVRFKTGSIFEVAFNLAFIGISIASIYYSVPKII